ncbi:MAG: hypothetical protein AABY19_03935, partial [Candidatus Thermoplasmatota archaeon]
MAVREVARPGFPESGPRVGDHSGERIEILLLHGSVRLMEEVTDFGNLHPKVLSFVREVVECIDFLCGLCELRGVLRLDDP